MSRLLSALAALAALAGPAFAEPPAEVVALQKTVHQLIDAAEPSIACLLVSRSEKYAELGQSPASDVEGKLGGFNPQQSFRFMDAALRELNRRLDLANPDTVPEAYGSGVVIDQSGLILTTYHVLGEKVKKVYVRLPGGRGSYADIVAADARADMAVLKMIVAPPGLKPVKFGDGGKSRKGDWVIALTHPFAAGFRDGSPSASWGILSNVRRRAPGPRDEAKRTGPLAQYNSRLQTDARLALGSSGGALFNLDGEMIGLTTDLAAVTGGETAGGYAVPLDANTKRMIEVLKRGEEIEYGFLGVTVDPEERAVGRGVVIRAVAPGLPAARAGLLPQDVVVAINGNPIREQDDLFLHISAALAGTDAKIDITRHGQPRTIEVRLAKSSAQDEKVIASNRPKPVFGLRVDYASTLALTDNPPEGVLVKDIEGGSAADKKLKEWHDRAKLIVTAVNGRPVATPAEFYREVAGKPSVRLTVVEAARTDGSRPVDVTLP